MGRVEGDVYHQHKSRYKAVKDSVGFVNVWDSCEVEDYLFMYI